MRGLWRATDHGLAVGLFGGSFNPAHDGHLHLATTAKTALGLDRVWWMPSPQNPLKAAQPPYDERARTIGALGLPPGMSVSHAERDLGTQYTIDTVRALKRRLPRTRFVYLIGADNLGQLPLWKDWQGLLAEVPICVISRPGPDALRARLGRVARQFAAYRLPEGAARRLKDADPPAWVFLTSPHNSQSSSKIRAATAKAKGR